MTFDLGGFLGAIVGVIGAYGVAKYSFSKQMKSEEPKRLRKTYDVCSSLLVILESAWWELNVDETTKITDFFEKVIQFIFKLKKLFPDAIETDQRLVKIVTDTIEGLKSISNLYSNKERNEDNYKEYINSIHSFILSKQNECREISEDIIEKMLIKSKGSTEKVD